MPHDVLNRLTSLDNTGITGVPAVVFNYLYDAVGDRINGSIAGQTDYSFDQLNRVTKITQFGTGVQNKRVDMTYNKVNQMTGLNRFSNLGGQSLVAETSYTYDQNQRLIQLAHKKGVNNLTSYDYTYDSANKLTKIASSLDGTIDYSYDATNQLTGAEHSSQTDEAYQYDANGNRTNAGYQTGTNNQLQADGQFIYEYDGEGNRTKRTEIATGKVTEYVWDYRNRLTGVLFKSAAGVVEKNVEYVYDTNNLRIGKKIDGVVTERFAIDRDQIALVFDGSGVQKSRYLYGTQIDQVLAEESGAQVHWFLTDHQGTVKDVVDNTGTVIDHVTYDSFGRIVGQTSSIDLRFAYTGREFDSETGQYYYRARYYDAAVGKFISEDPIGFAGGDSNLSRYVGNSAPNLIDPSGLQALEFNPIEKLIDEGGKAVAAAAALAAAATAKAAVDTYNAANNASGGAIGDGLNATGRFIGDRARDVDRFLVPPVADATLPPRPFRDDRPKPLPIPTIEPKTKLLPKPVPRNNPTPNPSPKGRPDLIPDPNCPEDKKKKTCKEKYPTYSTLSELAIEPFGGFKYSTLTDAKNSLQEIRANHSLPAVQEEGRLYPTGKRYFVEAINYGCKGPKKGHKDQPLHYNGITERTRFRDPIEQISGGSIGYCKVCTDSDSDARLIDRFIVLNVKNRQGTQSFTTY